MSARPRRTTTANRWKKNMIEEMRAAVVGHIESLREHREPVPVPSCSVTVVAVPTAA